MGLEGAGRSRGCHRAGVAVTALTQQHQRTNPVAREASRRTQATPPAVRVPTRQTSHKQNVPTAPEKYSDNAIQNIAIQTLNLRRTPIEYPGASRSAALLCSASVCRWRSRWALLPRSSAVCRAAAVFMDSRAWARSPDFSAMRAFSRSMRSAMCWALACLAAWRAEVMDTLACSS